MDQKEFRKREVTIVKLDYSAKLNPPVLYRAASSFRYGILTPYIFSFPGTNFWCAAFASELLLATKSFFMVESSSGIGLALY